MHLLLCLWSVWQRSSYSFWQPLIFDWYWVRRSVPWWAALCMPLSWYIMGSGRKDYPSGRQSGETALPAWSVQESSQWFTAFVWEEWEQQKNRWSIWHWCFSLGSVLWHLWFWECCHVSIRKRVEVDERNKIANLIDWYEKDQQCHTFCFRFWLTNKYHNLNIEKLKLYKM